MHRRNQPEEEQPDAGESAHAEDEFQREFEKAFEEAKGEFWQQLGIDPEELDGRKAQSPKPEGARLKDLYRQLVRRLHPDKKGKRAPREIEWWHQTQDAYQMGNIEQLELILTLVEMEDKGSKEASVSVLAQLTAEFKKSLRALKRNITSFKRDIAWNFSRLTDFTGLLEKTRQQLRADREQILWLLQKYERQIQSWELAATTPRKRAGARQTAWQDEEWF
jgi:hypothetical protein